MTNTNNPTGAKIIGNYNTSAFELKINKYIVIASDATPIYANDLVKTTGASNSDGIPICTKCNAGEAARGIVDSFEPLHADENIIYREANTERVVLVCDDPYVMFEMQVNGIIKTTDFGQYANIVLNGGNNITGLSNTQVDLSSLSTTSRQLKIVSVIQREKNSLGQYSKVQCIIHDHELQHGVGGSEENLWKRTGTTLEPVNSGDDVSANNAHFSGKLTVDGAIDPTALILNAQAVAPPATDGTIYYDSAAKEFFFRQNGSWDALSESIAWKRIGTVISPSNDGDDVDFGTGALKDDNVVTPITLGDASNIAFNTIDQSLVGSPNKMLTISSSAGLLSGGAITDAGGGNINIAVGVGLFRTTDTHLGVLVELPWSQLLAQAIPSDTIRYVGVQYNAGSPQVVIKTTDTWNTHTEFSLTSVVNESGTLHIIDNPWLVANAPGHAIERFYETQPFQRANRLGGLIVGETGTRNITLTAGEIYDRTNEFVISALDTSVEGGFDSYLGLTLSSAANTQWDNLNYNNAGVLTALGVSKWAVLWWYIEADDDLVMLYGTQEHNTSGSALLEDPPAVIPLRLQAHSSQLPVARTIFQQNAATGTFQTTFTTIFSGSSASDHTQLSNLTAGDAGHTQFAMLGGRSGGQQLVGGSGVSEKLKLKSNSTGTPGTVEVEAGETLTSDAIEETTGGNGVDVDGVLLKDGGATVDFFPAQLVFGEASAAPYSWFHLNSSTGTNVIDSSGFGRNLTTVNMVDGDWVPGLLNNCLQFAATKYAQAALTTDFDFDNTDAFSLECWVNTASTAASVIMSKMAQAAPNRGYQVVQKLTSAVPVFSLRNDVASNLITVEGSIGLSGSVWKHLVVTCDGSSTAAGVKIYVNAALNTNTVITDTLNATTLNTTKFQLSGRDGTTLNYPGKIDEIVVYDRVVDQTFITARYNGGAGTETIPGFSNTGTVSVNSSTGKMSQQYGGDFELATTASGSVIKFTPPANGGFAVTDGTFKVKTGTTINNISTDATLSGATDDEVSTSKAIKDFVENKMQVTARQTIEIPDITGNNTPYVMVYDTVDLDRTEDYEAGVFTAQVSGIYTFIATIWLRSLTSSHTSGFAYIEVNQVKDYRFYQGSPANERDPTAGDVTLAGAVTIKLDINDTVRVVVNILGGTQVVDLDGTTIESTFSAKLETTL